MHYLRRFDQTPFAVTGAGLAGEGYVYVPARCAASTSTNASEGGGSGGGCALHLFLHGCFGCATCVDGPNTTLVERAGFNRWAALNDAARARDPRLRATAVTRSAEPAPSVVLTGLAIAAAQVVLYPQLRNVAAGPNVTDQQRWGCWDSYGYGGPEYDLKDGAQIRALMAMVDHLVEGL